MSQEVVRLAAGGRTPMGPSETPRLRSGSPPSVEVVRVGRGRGVRRLAVAGMVGLIAGAPGRAVAHAFPERSEPRVGSTVRTAPPRVRIWFDGELEPAFSTVTVSDATGERVDRGDGAVEPTNRRLTCEVERTRAHREDERPPGEAEQALVEGGEPGAGVRVSLLGRGKPDENQKDQHAHDGDHAPEQE